MLVGQTGAVTSWAQGVPTPADLAVWRQVASVPSATGTFRWAPRGEGGFGWAFSGRPPALVQVPPDEDVAFWHVAPDRWRLEAAGELLAVSDGQRAVTWVSDGPRAGRTLLMPSGPAALLEPGHAGAGFAARRPGRDEVRDDQVERDDLLGRRAWRWRSGSSVWWLDEETGCGLRHESPGGTLELTGLRIGDRIDEAVVAVPAVDPAEVVEWPPRRPGQETAPAEPPLPPPSRRPEFTVTWWPAGALSYPHDGDPDAPEVLLVLNTVGDDTPEFVLGVAPAGTPARTMPGCAVRRWRGDGWEFALSWRGEVDPADVERVVASVPERW